MAVRGECARRRSLWTTNRRGHCHATHCHAKEQRRHADGPCIFKLPKKAGFAASHGLYDDGEHLVGSELVSLQHACAAT